MSDRRSSVLDFVYWTARRRSRGKFLLGKDRRLNQAAVARAMGIAPSTLSRVIDGRASPGVKFVEGLKAFSLVESDADLWDQIEHSPPAPAGAFLAVARSPKRSAGRRKRGKT